MGSGNDHVMDAISRFEQIAKAKGSQERHAPWRIFYRKEIYTPWYKPEEDRIATNLIYQQICRGVKFGEYRFDNMPDRDEKMADLAAKQYYVEHGSDIQASRVCGMVLQWIPDSLLDEKSASKWATLIAERHKLSEHVRGRWEPQKAGYRIIKKY
jgi:myosin-7